MPDETPTEPVALPQRRRSLLNIAFLVVGIVLFGFALARLDFETVADRLKTVGWFFIPSFVCYLGNLIFYSLSWRACIEDGSERASLGEIWQAVWASTALNAVTPGGGVGEVLKVSLLRHRIEESELVASVVLSNILNALVIAIATFLGATVCFAYLDVSREATGLVLGAAGAIVLGLALLFWWVRKGAAARILRMLGRLPFVTIADDSPWVARASELDARMADFVETRPAAVRKAAFFSLMVRLFQVGEVWFLLEPLSPEGPTLLIAILLQTVSQLIGWLAAFVPAQVGVLEGGSAGLFALAGLDPATAFAVVVARRARVIISVAIGLLLTSRSVLFQKRT